MKFPVPQTLRHIASLLNCNYVGADDFPVLGINEIHVVTAGDIVFVDHPKYYDKALNSNATVVLINKKVDCPEGKALLISDDPFRDFNVLTSHFKPFVRSSVSIDPSAKIGDDTHIQPNVYIGPNVQIGKNCLIHANVTIVSDAIVGDNVVIGSGTVLGGDAFYYKNRPEGYDQLLSCGRVVIEDDVHIGSGCTIDRGVTADTTIGQGSKLDNQIQVGHDTVIGKKCLIASQTGIAGCCIIEDEVTIWGQVGTNSGITIGAKAVILGQTGVTKSVAGNTTYFGTPIQESRASLKEMAALRQLPKLLQMLKEK
ncbi:UDP-3-O-(3-hydroxymyristoyl) glucosamine N-acyltransferase [Formosa sp. Hel3_A1_48]|jgi:UDP-3-O-[3-hydroxymyristoyl] glucosamine N-acyltransferase|uniref:UDP-3-O-(3-hydroxymyristoyl)glucosamine N-acyltransferase n=1 Tax=Formosa sp. Hel3_A1_48 TaxID=1336795 RepID=UPI00084E21BF|nr:UDP-3-O-(3-hydroxymyristoyl)glucosamine N-acyltransferase [Formosa sp. Hel3_A1_48]AOR25202.1 UDP-3-O-(3-hydroxymyristoyl) glucosamine N-acyltransferase [Formosa sp. Hel3_A1_48]MDC0949783.1 UDP-3-O-(3-hydroxymyristoyl)glucosamine N-acyltransferase [Flavobacteriaceae bacterium]MDG1672382.1 UDP-3-O-(3-hydroxymyristoyl)glucosamine N-acyltransferase [Flavobacteriaceae bacterium]